MRVEQNGRSSAGSLTCSDAGLLPEIEPLIVPLTLSRRIMLKLLTQLYSFPFEFRLRWREINAHFSEKVGSVETQIDNNYQFARRCLGVDVRACVLCVAVWSCNNGEPVVDLKGTSFKSYCPTFTDLYILKGFEW